MDFKTELAKVIYSRGNHFYFTLFLSIFLILALFRWEINGGVGSLIYYPVADTSIIMLLCLPLRGKWKFLTLIVPILLALLLWANVMFLRYFGDLIPSSLYISSGIFNNATFDGAFTALKWWDAGYLVFPLFPSIYVWKLRLKEFYKIKASIGLYLIDILLLLLSWTYISVMQYKSVLVHFPNCTFTEFIDLKFNSDKSDWKSIYLSHAVTGYLIKCYIKMHNDYITLSEKNKKEIKTFLSNNTKLNSSLSVKEPISYPKNLIFIVVESWPTATLELKNADYLMPTTTSLINDSTTVSGSMKVLAKYGNSSDAQFIYNTGLLPLRDEALVSRYSCNDYPSLAKAISGKSMEVIGENGHMWHHHSTSVSYGFNNLIEGLCLNVAENADQPIFKRALQETVALGDRFYLFITTYSMHSSYDVSRVSVNLLPDKLESDDPRDIEYLKRLNHFDNQLGIFLEGLKENGLYANSLIVIAGDHCIPELEVSELLKDERVPFLIVNSPIINLETQDFTQVDLFPTILYLMGIRYKFENTYYTGVGVNMFVKTDRTPSEEAYRISEWLIKRK